MSNHTVPAAAGGMPAPRRAVLIGGPVTTSAAITGLASAAAVMSAIPTWMALKIEVHRDAAAELGRRERELSVLANASASLDWSNPPAWYCEAEQARDAAEDRTTRAMTALLAERPRSLKDVQDRARYLVAIGAGLDGAQAATLILSMAGGEG